MDPETILNNFLPESGVIKGLLWWVLGIDCPIQYADSSTKWLLMKPLLIISILNDNFDNVW